MRAPSSPAPVLSSRTWPAIAPVGAWAARGSAGASSRKSVQRGQPRTARTPRTQGAIALLLLPDRDAGDALSRSVHRQHVPVQAVGACRLPRGSGGLAPVGAADRVRPVVVDRALTLDYEMKRVGRGGQGERSCRR